MFFYSEQTEPVDPHAANVSFLLKANGVNDSTDIVDNSANNLSITRYGNTKISTTQSKFGGSSLSFDGVSDYMSVQQSSLIRMGTGDFTIEGWVYINSFNSSGASGIFQISPQAGGFNGSTTNSIGLHLYSNNTWMLYANNSNYETAINKWSLNTWHHFAIVRNSSITKLYIDGIMLISTGDSVNYTSENLGIGSIYDATTYELNGYLDDFRVTKGVARYTANFTPPGAL